MMDVRRAFNGRRVFPAQRRFHRRFGERQDRSPLIAARVVAVVTVLTGCAYIGWAFVVHNPAHPIASGAFLAAEVSCLLLFTATTMSVWTLRFKPPEGLAPDRDYAVDVFIPVCGEPLDLIRATLKGVQAIRWHRPLAVHVLDDLGSQDVKSLAAEHGFAYLSRVTEGKSTRGAKAGNLNFGLSRTEGELILVLDADQVPQPNILEVLAGYMRFPTVSFVQSKQSFWVPRGDPFFNQDLVFYEAVQLACDSHDAAISCGSGVLYRRAALEDVGGFAAWNLVEDLTSSYELHSRGWKSFYYPHALSRGQAPSDIWGVYRQRGQWALDTMRLFFWDNPLIKRGLSWPQRMTYLVIPLSYLSAGIVFPLFYVIPIWTYLTGETVLRGPEWQFIAIRGVYFLVMAMALRLLFRKRQAGRQFQSLVGLFPVYLSAVFLALFHPPGRSPAYVPNNRARTSRGLGAAILATTPQMVLILANAVLPFYALFAGTASPRLIFANIFVSAVAIWSLMPIVLAALAKKAWNEQDSPYGVYGVTSGLRS
jgi:cellulose synthase (UDP-forming)